MSSSCRLTLLLALSFAAVTAVLAQSSSSSSNPDPAQNQPPAQAQGPTSGQLTVQARIKARRAQRRAAAIRDIYDHRYEAYTGMGYARFVPGPGTPAVPAAPATPTTPATPAVPHGPGLERAHEYAWNAGVTRYFNERMGVTADARGYYATAYVYLLDPALHPGIQEGITNPAISEYTAMAGPTYRFYLQPKFSVSGRVMGGMIYGKFNDDLQGGSPVAYGLWPNGYTFAGSASVPVEFNLTPRIGLRVAPEYLITGFGSTAQYSRAFTTGFVYRFGRQK
jgi:hypothetical protein